MGDSIETMVVRRQWNDFRQGVVKVSDFTDPHWSTISGGVGAPSPHPMVYGYIWCNQIISGEVGHSCVHGPAPHRILVCMVAKDNPRPLVKRMKAIADRRRTEQRKPELSA